ncbi:hypothetical protein SADUNF_Sadunf06G0214000 [Salix dunnii]|uniref:Pentatricopeptide repeat-containing protein n=1 Tax=Salix dunnii TaxID=1413687 RepID=A0A835MWC2_9ROSI|nr:hypothetical protein SADUNF_Sadunf06G0214000 [Salix dunnii]
MAGLSCNCVLPSPEIRKWNEIIKKNMLDGDAVQAMVTYVNVQEIGFHADNFTFPILLKAAGSWSSPCIGLALHVQTIKAGFSSHVFFQTALLNMYRSHRCVADACKVFEKMPVKDVVAWNSILDACASTGKMDDALKVFNSMPLKDLSSFNIMISGYSSSGKTLSARSIFDNMAKKDIVSWNSMILAYIQGEDMERACVTGVLSACAHSGSLKKGTEAHIYAIDNGLASSPHVTTALIDMYAKCGSIQQVLEVFYKSQVKDICCWNAFISGLALHENAYPDEAVAETSILDIPKLIVVEKKRDFAALSLEEILDPQLTQYIVPSTWSDDGDLQPLIFIVCCNGTELVSYKCSTSSRVGNNGIKFRLGQLEMVKEERRGKQSIINSSSVDSYLLNLISRLSLNSFNLLNSSNPPTISRRQ